MLLRVSVVCSLLLLSTGMVWMYHSLTFCLLEGHLGGFQFGAVTDKAVVSICIQVFCVDLSFHFSRINA